MNHFVFLSFYFGAKNGSPALGMANSLVVRVSPGRIYFEQNMLFLVKLNPEFLFLFSAKKKAFIVSFRWDTKILTADRTAGSAAVCKERQAGCSTSSQAIA